MSNSTNHTNHYQNTFQTKQIECMDIVKHLDFIRGNIVKYVWRAGKKGNNNSALEDLKKATEYLHMLTHENDFSNAPEINSALIVFDMIEIPDESNAIELKKHKIIQNVLLIPNGGFAEDFIRELVSIIKEEIADKTDGTESNDNNIDNDIVKQFEVLHKHFPELKIEYFGHENVFSVTNLYKAHSTLTYRIDIIERTFFRVYFYILGKGIKRTKDCNSFLEAIEFAEQQIKETTGEN